MAAEEDTEQSEPRSGLAAKKFRGRPRHGTELGSTHPKVRFPSPRPGTSARTHFPTKPDTPRSSEPILIPKLRIQFADFPYLHYSID